ncbi:MAG: hypothetical protein HQL10_05515 [Nitrospirae bacterium]|nr:hypothetical protein [Nitrospirota bacterium]
MEQDGRQVSDDASEGVEVKDCPDKEGGDTSEDCAFAASGDLVVRDISEMKVLDNLKTEVDTLDVGKTIKDLFTSMQNMDVQLNSVLAINAALEKDIKASKDVIAKFKAERDELEQTVVTLREEMPSKRELKAEIAHLIDERNEAQASIRSMKIVVDKTLTESKDLRNKVADLENEKADLLRDISYIELKLNAALEKLNLYAKEITTLQGEKVSNQEKIDSLRLKYDKCVEEKTALLAGKNL